MKSEAESYSCSTQKDEDITKDSAQRAFLIKMLELNRSAYRRKDDTPQNAAKKYGY